MERRKLFTRLRRSSDLSQPADDLEQAPKLPGDRAEEAVPVSATPPDEAPSAQAPEEAEKSEKRQRRKTAKERKTRAPVANLALVRRERRALLRERERRIRDLGGLMLEMYRHDQFHEDLIVEHCAQTMGVENRIHELEAILTRATSRRATPGPHCVCGTPLLFGARFCASCGRATDLGATGELCARCLAPISVGASFCASCGAAVGAAASPGEAVEQTVEHPPDVVEEGETGPPEDGD